MGSACVLKDYTTNENNNLIKYEVTDVKCCKSRKDFLEDYHLYHNGNYQYRNFQENVQNFHEDFLSDMKISPSGNLQLTTSEYVSFKFGHFGSVVSQLFISNEYPLNISNIFRKLKELYIFYFRAPTKKIFTSLTLKNIKVSHLVFQNEFLNLYSYMIKCKKNILLDKERCRKLFKSIKYECVGPIECNFFCSFKDVFGSYLHKNCKYNNSKTNIFKDTNASRFQIECCKRTQIKSDLFINSKNCDTITNHDFELTNKKTIEESNKENFEVASTNEIKKRKLVHVNTVQPLFCELNRNAKVIDTTDEKLVESTKVNNYKTIEEIEINKLEPSLETVEPYFIDDVIDQDQHIKDPNWQLTKVNDVNERFTVVNSTSEHDLENCKDIDTKVNKKRAAPDFDNYTTSKNIKKIKLGSSVETVEPLFIDDAIDQDEHEDIKDPNWQLMKVNNVSEGFTAVKNQWKLHYNCNPHKDLTFRNMNFDINKSSNSSYNNVHCLSTFDKKIRNLDVELTQLNKRICTLYRECDSFQNYNKYRSYQKIDDCKKHEEKLKNEYANLCDARDEVKNLYKFYKNRSRGLNGEYISHYQNKENENKRKVIDLYDEFYGPNTNGR